MKKHIEIDDIDKQILSILMKDAKVSYQEIGKRIFVSPGTVHVRLKKLQKSGLIKGSQIVVDYNLLGYDIAAFLGIYLEKSSLYDQVLEALNDIPEVVGAHYTTGVYSIFAKIVCKDTDHLRTILSEKIQLIKGIQRTETFISLHESINRPLEINA